MIHRIRIGTFLRMGFASLFLVGFAGCGGGGDDSANDSSGLLTSDLQALDTRLQSHMDIIQGSLGPEVATAGSGSQQNLTAAAAANPDWGAIQAERDRYGREMGQILGSLGQDVTVFGECQIRYGDTTYGPPDGFGWCSCQPYFDGTVQELDRHLQDMFSWMTQRNASGLWQEMGRHRDQMRSHIRNMGSHMDQQYGHNGWDGAWDDDSWHRAWDGGHMGWSDNGHMMW